MIINAIAHYLPKEIVTNKYFEKLNGLSDEHIVQRTGIKSRVKAAENENTNTMSIDAVRNAVEDLPYSIKDVDLIVGATYSPYDTVGTMAHVVQQKFDIDGAQVLSVSSACSSFVNALEIVEGYFAMNKATKALVIAAEHNTHYNNETNIYDGHLWGDGAAAVFVSKEKHSDKDMEIVDLKTIGLGNIDKGPEGVYLRPRDGGIVMPDGKNVFINAIKYMAEIPKEILKNNNLTIDDLSYFIPHQANKRIIDNVAKQLNLEEEQVFINIDTLGNTGCASSAIALSQNFDKFKKGENVVLSVFGGGYSAGGILLRK